MLLTVDHSTLYHYDQPVRAVMQSHRLTPARFDGQKVIDWTITVAGGEMGGGFRDGAGDWVQGWTVKGPVSTVEVRVQGQVETTDLAGVLRGRGAGPRRGGLPRPRPSPDRLCAPCRISGALCGGLSLFLRGRHPA